MNKTNESVQKRVDIGGQAVMEGVMMKAPRAIAVSVRRPDHTIVTQLKPYTPLSEKHKWMGYPFLQYVHHVYHGHEHPAGQYQYAGDSGRGTNEV